MNEYEQFIVNKIGIAGNKGFEPLFMPGCLKDFQAFLCDWQIRKGRAATFSDCGTGKTLMELVAAQNFAQKTNKPTLILAPLAVAHQTVKEGAKFDIPAARSYEGEFPKSADIVVGNYERLHFFDPNDFGACILDESSILKNFQGVRKGQITEFMRRVQYRQLFTATAAPNDYIELGTSAEALGEMGYMDMLAMFFGNNEDSLHPMDIGNKFYLKPHAKTNFWRWVCSWARAMRLPSDFGFSDDGYILPELIENEHIVESARALPGMLFPVEAITLSEQRAERNNTVQERCEKVVEVVEGHDCSVIWANLNPEGELLAQIVPGAVEVSGKDSDKAKEEKFDAFANGQIKRIVTKPKIGGFGLNWQHCAHCTFFASHSFEQKYQCLRRVYRFGQKRSVTSDTIFSKGEQSIFHNFQRKAKQADEMFAQLVSQMNDALKIENLSKFEQKATIPSWM